MPGKRARGPPTKIPAAPDPRTEMRLQSENLAREIERKQKQKVSLSVNKTTADKKLSNVKVDQEQVLKDTYEVVGDITREFKVQQNDYRKQIEELQNYVTELEKKLAATQMKIRNTRDKFERQRCQKDDIIQKNIIKSEQMAQEFRDMLKGTLVKMSDRIEMSRESDDQPVTDPNAAPADGTANDE
ncbi:hypothetical protein TRFO_05210 [Tritrichomonas foetus]|uniref:Dynein regulatory complex protein 12 n=1 Tax=Tritrichomonas foetus TaxID=1144522 RepID=A0A1J4KDM5_9EUKA|nr:hypothetical protein TRFO_05210 [Tritrichomonas foetus]|eukprot:OHT07565.1 hypothetical protein TRFO_05210 [Tritrichomonas foetus]